MITIDTTADKNDIFLDNKGNLATVIDLNSLRLRLQQRLNTFLGEWFIDRTFGVPYFQIIFNNPEETAVITNIINTEILKETEIVRLDNVNAEFIRDTRTYTYNAEIASVFSTFDFIFINEI